MNTVKEIATPDEYAARIFEISGYKIDPDLAEDVWTQVLQHKWVLSERIGRDVGLRIAALDFLENIYSAEHDLNDALKIQQLNKIGAQIFDKAAWDTISPSQPPKQIVEKRIVLPLIESGLARKHGVSPPRSIIFFGPPGTGKTHFARAIAAKLAWWFVEVSPSELMSEGEDRMGARLKQLFEMTRNLDDVVIFIDEFEEIAASRDNASRTERSITNEFLKQVPLFRREKRRNLLVCATNYIRQLDAALIRPGRFDCIIPVGDLDHKSRCIIFEHFLSKTHHANVAVDRVVAALALFTPADIEYLFHKVSQYAFEKEYAEGVNFAVSTETFLEKIAECQASLTQENIVELEEDSERYTRY